MNPQVVFYIAQGISVITGIFAIIMMQLKNMKTILLFQIIVNATALSNYFLLGGNTGVFISVLAIVQSVAMYLYNLKQRAPHLAVIIAFILAYAAASAYNIAITKSLIELLPAFAAICFSISLVQTRPVMFRVWGTLGPAFWLGYDVYTRSYVMFCVHLGITVASIVAMIRLDGLFRRGNLKK